MKLDLIWDSRVLNLTFRVDELGAQSYPYSEDPDRVYYPARLRLVFKGSSHLGEWTLIRAEADGEIQPENGDEGTRVPVYVIYSADALNRLPNWIAAAVAQCDPNQPAPDQLDIDVKETPKVVTLTEQFNKE